MQIKSSPSILKKIITLILLIGLLFQLQAQKYTFDAQRLTKDDGLANLYTTAVAKDDQGFLWIATKDGLSRFDGYQFDLYPEGKNLADEKQIQQIKKDSKGNLWLIYSKNTPLWDRTSAEAIHIFNPKTKKSVSFDDYFQQSVPFKANTVFLSKVIDPKNRVWITTLKGELFLLQKGRFKKIYEDKALLFQYVTIDSFDRIWIGAGKNLIQISLEGKKIEKTLLFKQIRGIWTNNRGKIWLATGAFNRSSLSKERNDRYKIDIWSKKKMEPLVKFHLFQDGQKIEALRLNINAFIHRDQNGFWYLVNEKKLLTFNQDGHFLRHVHRQIEYIQTSYSNSFEDNATLWLTSPIGLVKIKSNKSPFNLIHHTAVFSDCRGISEDKKGNIYFHNKEIYKLKAKTEELVKLPIAGYSALKWTDNILLSGIYNDQFLIREFDFITNQESFYPRIDEALLAYTILATDQSYSFLIGRDKGLCYLDTQQKKLCPFEKYNGFEVLKESIVYHFYRNSTGIWLATNNGVFLMNEKEGILRQYDVISKDLPYNQITYIYEDTAGIFWLATRGGGVIRWQPSLTEGVSSVSQQLTINEGLSDDKTHAIYEDGFGRLWIPSDKGLMSLDKNSLKITTYLVENGLPHNEFNLTAHFQAKDSTLYFGGLGGLIAFKPSDIPLSIENKALLRFTEITVWEVEADSSKTTDKTELLQETNKVIIQPNNKLLELKYALLDFDSPKNHLYEYKIEGYHDKWIYTDGNNLRITHLPYGTYNLKIRGRNIHSDWSKEVLNVAIHVVKPFYLRNWFIAAAIAFLLFAMFLLVKGRLFYLEKIRKRLEPEVEKRTQKNKNDKLIIEQQALELKKLDATKSRFFTNVIHEFKTPLTLISSPLKDILNTEKLTDRHRDTLTSIYQNTQKMMDLVTELLNLSKMETNQLSLKEEKVFFYSLIRRLVATYTSYAQYRSIDLQFNYHAERNIKLLLDLKKIEKIINNLLSNALKFTKNNGKIILEVIDLGEQLKIVVTDRGEGIHSEDIPFVFDRFFQSKNDKTALEGGTGIGLALSKEYVKLMQGTLTVESKIGKGSTFTLIFPKKEIFSGATEIGLNIEPEMAKKKMLPTLPKNRQHLILIVEDNKEMAEYIQSILANHYRVIIADNGGTALAQLAKQTVDLIISDVIMPQMDGFQLLAEVKKQAQYQYKPFIMLTAKIENADRLQALRLGVDDYMTKPFHSEELRARVVNILANLEERKNYIQSISSTQKNSTQKVSIALSFEEIPSVDTLWLEKLETTVKKKLGDSSFSVARLALEMAISERSLRTKIKTYTGLSPSAYIKEARLQKAHQLLKSHTYHTISKVTYAIGLKHPTNFTNMYKQRFGKLPSEEL